MLSRAAIQAAQDFTAEEIHVPEWGGMIRLRSMTSKALDDMHVLFMRAREGEVGTATQNGHSARAPDAYRDLRVRLLAHCLCDANGQLLFDDEEGLEILREKSAAVIERLFDAAMRLNKLTDEAVKEEKKDSPGTPATASASSSPAPLGAPSPNSTSA